MGNTAGGVVFGALVGGPIGAIAGGMAGAIADENDRRDEERYWEDVRRWQREERERRRREERERYEREIREAEERRQKAEEEARRQEQLRREQKARAERQRQRKARRQREQREAQKRAAECLSLAQELAEQHRLLGAVQARWNEKRAALRTEEAKLADLARQVAAEEKEIARFSVERTNRRYRVLVAMGTTGLGKSTFCNRLAGDKSAKGKSGGFKVSSLGSLRSETTEIQKLMMRHVPSGMLLAIVDTPGANDSMSRDRTFANKLAKFLRGSGGVNAFLLFFDLTNSRLTHSYKQYLLECKARFGQRFWRHVIVVATKADKEEPEEVPRLVERLLDCMKKTLELPQTLSLPCVAVGHGNYGQAVEELLAKMRRDRFLCEAIKSPIDDLKAKHASQSLEVQNLRSQRDALGSKISSLRSQTGNKEAKLDTLKRQIARESSEVWISSAFNILMAERELF